MTWDATYVDARGRFPATIANDGETLVLSVLSATFSGYDFSELAPQPNMPEAQLDGFILRGGKLAACEIVLTMNLPLIVDAQLAEGALVIEVRLRGPGPDNGCYEALNLTLTFGDARFTVSDTENAKGYIGFEDQLLDLIVKLPPGLSIKSCFTCQYADYGVLGSPSFGGMMCFRTHKSAYDSVRTKYDFMGLEDQFDRNVQETWLCPDYTPRQANAGYRGWPESTSKS